ncbi:MAG: hypothetical protein F4X92_02735 [Gammaproteobacteria bacterium]|nr:hypothetical protein [Gammaproteobacteria bacterium]
MKHIGLAEPEHLHIVLIAELDLFFSLVFDNHHVLAGGREGCAFRSGIEPVQGMLGDEKLFSFRYHCQASAV